MLMIVAMLATARAPPRLHLRRLKLRRNQPNPRSPHNRRQAAK